MAQLGGLITSQPQNENYNTQEDDTCYEYINEVLETNH